MKCPDCSAENPDHELICNNCGNQLPPPDSTESIQVRTSNLAIIAFVLAILSYFSCGITSIPAIILGIMALTVIDPQGGRVTGRGLATTAIILSVIGCTFLGVLPIMLHRIRGVGDYRMQCGTGLSGMGKAMLIYANDYEDELPRAAGKSSQWTGKTPNWKAPTATEAFAINPDGTGGQVSITASLYLLVKYTEFEPKYFWCPNEKGMRTFHPKRYGLRADQLTDLWDFGPDPTKHVSYAFHNPYGQYALTTSSYPGMAVAADRNPWQQSTGARTSEDWEVFDPELEWPDPAIRRGNSTSHEGQGQNIVFLDSHVEFAKRPTAAINDDNIYTYWSGSDRLKGNPPTLGSQPADRLDSLLVNDGRGIVQQ